MSYKISYRLPRQLDELETSLRAVIAELTAVDDRSIDIKQLYCPDVYGPTSLNNAISVRCTATTEERKLILYPMHANAQAEISVGIQGLDNLPFGIDDRNGTRHLDSIESVGVFHSRFQPLPANWPAEYYRSIHRIITQLDSRPEDAEIDAIVAALDSVQSACDPVPKPDNSSVLLTCLDAEVMPAAIRTRDALNFRSGWRVDTILIDRLADYHALLANATLAFYATEPLCADALMAGVPCFTWGSDTSNARLQEIHDIRFANAPLHGHMRIKYISELNRVLHHWCVAGIESTDLRSASIQPEISEAQIISTILTPAVDAEEPAELATRLGRSLDQGQRKFRKFRESPSRFINDSQSPLLRPFQHKRPSS